MEVLNKDAVSNELANVAAIDELDAGLIRYPYPQLPSQDFELLNFSLFKTSAPRDASSTWDEVSITLPGSDGGRDLVLTEQGVLCGIVQCKGRNQRLSLPQVFEELAKTVLLLEADDSVTRQVSTVRYFLATARDPAQTVIDLFSRPREILRSRTPDFDAAIARAINTNKKLHELDLNAARAEVVETLALMPLQLVRPHDLDLWLWRETRTAMSFFRHKNVLIDDSRMQSIEANLANMSRTVACVPALTDIDLQVIRNYIENVPESHRLSLGFASLFGFPREMFSDEADFRRRVAPIANLLNELHSQYMAWMFERASLEAQRICRRPDVMMAVHPFSRQIPAAFLGTMVRDLMSEALHGDVMGQIVQNATGEATFRDYDTRLAHVRGELLDQGRQYLAKDYSQVVGTDELLAFKLELIRFMMQGIQDASELERVIDEGEEILRPFLEASSRRLEQLASHRPSVFLMGTSGLDDTNQISRMGQTLKALNDEEA